MVLLGWFNPNKYIMKEVNETSIKEATRFEIILRDFKNWRRDKII